MSGRGGARARIFFAAIFFLALRAHAQDFFDRLDQSLTISTFDDQLRARVSGLLDLEYYHFPQPPPGLIRSGGCGKW